MAPSILPPQAFLAECFTYDPSTGVLMWRARPRSHFPFDRAWKMWNTQFANTIAGAASERDYVRILLAGRRYIGSRIIWKLVTGEEPPPVVEHHDRNFRNNRWLNLRSATQQQNTWNQKARPSRSGMKGAYLLPGGRYQAKIMVSMAVASGWAVMGQPRKLMPPTAQQPEPTSVSSGILDSVGFCRPCPLLFKEPGFAHLTSLKQYGGW